MFKSKSKDGKALLKYLKEFGLEACASKLKDLGVERREDLTYLTDDMIKGFNPIQQQKLRSAIEGVGGGGGDTGTLRPSSTEPSADKTSTLKGRPPIDPPTSPRPSAAQQGPKARALYDYKAQKEGQLDLHEGDIVTVLDSSNKWWDVIHDETGEKGKVPSNFMDEIEEDQYEDPPDEAPPATVPREESARPDLPEEELEAIYEPVDDLTADKDEPEYEDPDAGPRGDVVVPKPPPRPNKKRSESVKIVPEAKPLSDDPLEWNSADVLRWLEDNDLKDFKDVFYANGFEGPMLLTLSSSSFKAGGFDPDRCKVLQKALDSINNNAKPVARARVLYDYDATKPKQLTIREGEILDILDESSAWWNARNSKGGQGQVPSNYLEKLVDESAASIIDSQDLSSQPWFCDCDRSTAEVKVRAQGVGAYLVRPSQTTKGDHTLTAMGEGGIMNLKIQQRDKFFVLGQFSSRFPSILELIEHHNRSEIKVTGKPSVILTKAVGGN